MELFPPHIYTVEFNKRKILHRHELVGAGEDQSWRKVNTFKHPLTSDAPKLYVFSDAGSPYYVGITRQSLSTRFNLGFKASTENRFHGYGGYAFKEHETRATLHVFVEKNPIRKITKLVGKNKARREKDVCCSANIETVEAELVYWIRNTAGAWPKHQTEIHFSPFPKDHTNCVNSVCAIYDTLKDEPLPPFPNKAKPNTQPS